MINLLPNDLQKKNKALYNQRVASTALVLLGLLCVSGAILLLPSYILTGERARSIEGQWADIQANQTTELGSTRDVIASLNDTLALATSFEDTLRLTEVVTAVIAARGEGSITIDSFSLEDASGKKALFISGVAATREELIQFTQELKRLPTLTGVELPVSNLADSENNHFSITALLIKPGESAALQETQDTTP